MSGDDSMTPEHLKASTSWTGASLDNSLENEEKDDVKMGMGRGKPMSALTGKRKRMGLFARSRGGFSGSGSSKPDPSFSPTTPGSSPPSTIIEKKRANEVRRRGRQPKIRGMVGLQRPQAEPGADEDNEEDSKMVCVA